MKKVLILIFLSFFALFVYAQEESVDPDYQDISEGEEAEVATLETGEAAQQGNVRVSELLEYDVMNNAGNYLGEIEDLVILSDGSVPYALIEFDTEEVFDDRELFVPLSALQFSSSYQEDGIVFIGDLSELDQARAPVFEGDDLDAALRAIGSGIDEFWGSTTEGQEPEYEAVLASDLLDYDIADEDGDEMADVEEIVLNLQSMNIEYLAVASGGFLGIGDKLYALPMENIILLRDEEEIIVPITEDAFESAEGFSDDNWPDRAESWNNFE